MHFTFFLDGVELETRNLFEAVRFAKKTRGLQGVLEGINPATGKRFRCPL